MKKNLPTGEYTWVIHCFLVSANFASLMFKGGVKILSKYADHKLQCLSPVDQNQESTYLGIR